MEQKQELQPVHRIFLGELFVFIFFFAGAMSVLVGPCGVPLLIAAGAIAASVIFSIACFLWLAFTTPQKKAEPRYAFMVLSLMPGAIICTAVLAGQSFKEASSGRKKVTPISVLSFKKYGTNPMQLSPEQRQKISMELYANESAVLKEELRVLNFDSIDESQNVVRFHKRGLPQEDSQEVAVLELFGCDSRNAEASGEYSYDVQILDLGKRSVLYRLKDELRSRMTKNLEARKAEATKRQLEQARP